MELSETDFFDTMTIQNDQISYIKHGLAPLYVFFTLFGCWLFGGGGGGAGGYQAIQGTTCFCKFRASESLKMELSITDFFDTVTIQNDQISYVKHGLAPLYVFFTLFGCWRGGGGRAPKGSTAQPANAVFQPRQLTNQTF